MQNWQTNECDDGVIYIYVALEQEVKAHTNEREMINEFRLQKKINFFTFRMQAY